MRWTSMLAIYAIMWFFALFIVLPFHARRNGADEALVRGQDAGAPASFPVARVVMQTSLVTLVIFGAYYLNYVNGWVTARDIDLMSWLADHADAATVSRGQPPTLSMVASTS